MISLWHSAIYTEGLDPSARFPRERYRLVRTGLGDNQGIEFREPEAIAPEFLLYAHDQTYVNDFLSGQLSEKKVRRIGLRPWSDQIVERTLILTGGTVAATRHVLASGGISGNLGGGTHHGYHDFGSGYCIFNDLAVSARIAQQEFGIRRVLILDLDVHQGDGTAAILEGDETVRTVSFHCGMNFPFRKMMSDHDEVFGEDVGDEVWLQSLRAFLPYDLDRFQPELILFQAGVDTLKTDRLGHLSLTREGLRERNRIVFSEAKDRDIPLVITMGGGYGEPIETSVAAHVDLFEQAAGLFL